MLYIDYDNTNRILSNIKTFILKKYLFFVVVLVFAICKFTIFEPSGLYSTYNDINFSAIGVFMSVFRALYNSFLLPVSHSLLFVFSDKYLLVISLVVITSLVALTRCCKDDDSSRYVIKYARSMMVGLAIFVLGSLPYLMVGKVPVNIGPNSRSELLLPLGFAIITVYLVKLIFAPRFVRVILSFLVFSFIALSANHQYNYLVRGVMNDSVIVSMQRSNVVKNNTTFFYNYYTTPPVLAVSYAMSGMSRKAFGDSKRIYYWELSPDHANAFVNGFPAKLCNKYAQYNCKDWVYSKPVHIVIRSTISITPKLLFELEFYKLFNRSEYDIMLPTLTSISVQNAS
jgi:hypothetical protein